MSEESVRPSDADITKLFNIMTKFSRYFPMTPSAIVASALEHAWRVWYDSGRRESIQGKLVEEIDANDQ